jgi:hypothetical protein
MLVSRLRLGNANVELLGVPIMNTAHTRLVVHVRDHIGIDLLQHDHALQMFTWLHGKVARESH